MTDASPSPDPDDESLPDREAELTIERDRLRARLRQSLFGRSSAPTKIGRFMVVDKLGEGGMGVVYTAYDPQLKREVAVKLLQAGDGDEGQTAGRARLLREAQAMARLSHPNVLPVFEAGEHDGRIFMAMELVKGRTLAGWLRAEDRDWRQIVDMFRQAAEGLAVAHAADLVHRDFKPENVMVGEDGRARVMDFGLARPAGGEDLGQSHPALPRDLVLEDVDGETPLTRTGTVLGTPAYMSPEQHRGAAADARSDQFSWCVALWEALYGARPFTGRTYGELALAVHEGAITEPKSRVGPEGLTKLLRRGLASEPDDRFADLPALLAELDRVTSPRGRWPSMPWIAGLGAGAVALATGIGWSMRSVPIETAPAAEPCPSFEEMMAGVDDEATYARVREMAARHRDQPWVQNYFTVGMQSVEAWVDEMRDVHTEACEARRSDDEDARTRGALQLQCIREGVDVAHGNFRGLFAQSPEAITTLAMEPPDAPPFPDPAECRNGAALRRLALAAEQSPEQIAIMSLGVQMAGLAVNFMARGERDAALALRDARAAMTMAVDDPELRARALLDAVNVRQAQERGSPHSNEVLLDEALLAAETAGAADLTARLLYTRVVREAAASQPSETTLRRADAAAERAGWPFALKVQSKQTRAVVARHAGDPDAVADAAREIAGLFEARYGPDDLRTLTARHEYARELFLAGDAEGSLEVADAVLAKTIRIRGADSPALAERLDWRAHLLDRLGRHEQAAAEYARLVRILEPIGPTRRLGWVLFKLGMAEYSGGHALNAIAHWEASEKMLTEVVGRNHSETLRGPTSALIWHGYFVGQVEGARARLVALREATRDLPGGPHVNPDLLNIDAALAARSGNMGEAMALLSERDALWEPSHEVDTRIAAVIGELWRGLVAREAGDGAEARRHLDVALQRLDESDGALVAWQRAEVTAWAGIARAEAGDYEAARPTLQLAMQRLAEVGEDALYPFTPRLHEMLARTLIQTGGDRDEALTLARRAVEEYAQLGDGLADERLALERWLAPRAAADVTDDAG